MKEGMSSTQDVFFGARSTKMFTDYTCHVFGERNAAHLTLLLEMSAVFIL